MSISRACAIAVTALAALVSPARAQAPPGMPDARQMSGVPLPVGDLAAGTVTVRVVRGAMTNPVKDQAVELIGGQAPVKATTNEAGRAEFTGLAPGTRVKAVTIVDGVRLESQEFAVPATGGVRVALVGAAPGGAAAVPPPPAAAAQPGAVMLGEESRIVIEMGDEDINVFNIFQLLNRSPTPVQPAEPLVFDLPARARGAGLLDGSTPLGKLEGKVVTVSGPFPPGSTLLQFAYSIPFGSGTVVIDQKLPAALDHVAVVVQKVGPMRLESPQVAEQREMPAQGQTYIAARGRGLKAGETLSLTVSGLPHSPTWPRNVALALAVVVLAAGVWASARPARASTATDSRRKQLTATRERLFRELTAIEDQHRDGTIDPERYATRRREMIAGLERIYAQLDEDAAA